MGRTYPGPWQSKENEPTHEGFEPPHIYWMPSISVSGLTFYTGDKLAKWKGDLFVGGLRRARFPARASSIACCSTTRWKSCVARLC